MTPPTLKVVIDGHATALTAALTWTDGGVQGAAIGDLTLSEARGISVDLIAGRPPRGPSVPWALAVVADTGCVYATSSPMLNSGLFLAAAGDRFALATDPGALLGLTWTSAAVDADYVIDYLAMRAPADRTPFRQLRRLPPGIVLVRRPNGSQLRRQWSGPQAWSQPFREGPGVPTDYVRVFDAAVDDAVARIRPGPLVVLLSGGLDSTFLAASLARHATSDHPVIGLVHRPVAQAPERPAGNAVHDEWEYAQRLAASSSGRIELEPITNDDAQCSLDVALANARRGWLPTRNPANSVWTTAARARAVDLGANRLFNGGTGNFSYSNPHSYAPGYLLRRGRVRPFTRLVSARAQTAGWRRAVRSTLGQLTYDLRHRDDGTRDYVSLFDMDPELVGCSRPRSTYPAFLEAMADLGISNMGAVNPARVEGVLAVDPFEAPSVLQFAAEITPAEWVRHGTQRGFARAAAAGRVPDAIRLRRSRGGQSMDSWWAARQHRGTYLAQAAATADTPVVRDIVDCAALLRRVTAWPWDSPVGPTPVELVAVERLLHTSAYLRWVQEAAKGR